MLMRGPDLDLIKQVEQGRGGHVEIFAKAAQAELGVRTLRIRTGFAAIQP
jgi:hypothetical protein